MESKTTAVYPAPTVATVQVSNAPPPYTSFGSQPTFVEMQPVQPVVVQPSVVQPTYIQPVTVVAVHVKVTDHDQPHLEYCPRCQTTVTTRTVYSPGACWWIICIIGCFAFWPIWCWLCCRSSKDVKHFCPNCANLLAVKKRAC